jgi:hypothetical protein
MAPEHGLPTRPSGMSDLQRGSDLAHNNDPYFSPRLMHRARLRLAKAIASLSPPSVENKTVDN